eukprot:1161000-Pelagomonas_calceolata.AAC.6
MDVAQGTEVVAQGTEDVAQGTEDVAQGTEVVAQGTEVVAQGTVDVAQGIEDVAQGTEVVAQGAEDVAKGTEDVSQGIVDACHVENEHAAHERAAPTNLHINASVNWPAVLAEHLRGCGTRYQPGSHRGVCEGLLCDGQGCRVQGMDSCVGMQGSRYGQLCWVDDSKHHGHAAESVKDCFVMAKDAGFKVWTAVLGEQF